jgi:CBS domain-containing protein
MPLDGGRVLRALLWRLNKNFRAATQMAVRAGLMIAITLIVMGILYFRSVDWVMGMWMMIVGLIVALMLGTTEGRSYGVWRVRRGTVEDVMNRNVVQIPPEMKVSDFINKVLQNNHHTTFPVVRDRRLHGMLMLKDLKSVPREDWARLEVREVMRPVDASMFINANTIIAQAQTILSNNGMGRAVVIDSNGLIVGYVSLRDVKSAK